MQRPAITCEARVYVLASAAVHARFQDSPALRSRGFRGGAGTLGDACDHKRRAPTRHAVTPGDGRMGEGNLPVLTMRQNVASLTGTNCGTIWRTRTRASSARSRKAAGVRLCDIGFEWLTVGERTITRPVRWVTRTHAVCSARVDMEIARYFLSAR